MCTTLNDNIIKVQVDVADVNHDCMTNTTPKSETAGEISNGAVFSRILLWFAGLPLQHSVSILST
jgi:hypothetical protein